MNGVVIAETLRRHVTNIGYWAYVALMAIISVAASFFNSPAAVWPTLVALLALGTGSAVIGPEFSSGTLQLILVKPITRASYLVSRVLGVLAAVSLAAGIAFTSEVTGRALFSKPIAWEAQLAGLVNSIAGGALIVALLALLGSLTRGHANVGLYLLGQIGVTVTAAVLATIRLMENAAGRFLTSYPGIEKAVSVVGDNLFPDVVPQFAAGWLLLVLSNAAVAILLACLAFRRREVPYGAD